MLLVRYPGFRTGRDQKKRRRERYSKVPEIRPEMSCYDKAMDDDVVAPMVRETSRKILAARASTLKINRYCERETPTNSNMTSML